jgi:uncharacterized protein (DUF58 family)
MQQRNSDARAGRRGLWLRFLAGLAVLALSFVLALLSTAARQSLHPGLSEALAAMSLLLAALAAVATLPPLLRRIAGGRVREVLRYDLTREGLLYFLLILLITLAAINTGNNLLFLIVAAMLAAIVASGIVSAAVLGGMSAEMELPTRLFARQKAVARLALRNRHRFFPAFSVRLTPPPAEKPRQHWQTSRTVFEFPKPRADRPSWLRLPDLKLERVTDEAETKSFFEGGFYLPYLAPRAARTLELPLLFANRGLYKQQRLAFVTRFPFAFLRKSRIVPLAAEALVYPCVTPTARVRQWLPQLRGERESLRKGSGNDLYGVRDYRPGDPARRMDWKASARSGSLKLREFSNEQRQRLRLVFDNPAPGVLTGEAYERGVEETASLAWHLMTRREGLSFVLKGGELSDGIDDFLRYLATVQPAVEEEILNTLPHDGARLLIFTARPASAIPAAIRESAQLLPLG